MAAMSAAEVRDRLADRFRLLHRPEYGPERQLDAASTPSSGPTTCSTDDEAGALRDDVGLRRRLRPPCPVRRRRPQRRRGGAPAPRLAGAQVARRRRPRVRPAPATACSRPSGSSPRTRLADPGSSRRCATGMRRTSAARPPAGGSGGTARLAGPGRLGARPSWPTCGRRYRWSARARAAGGGDRRRGPRRADGLLRAAVRDARRGPRSCSTRPPRPTYARLPAPVRRGRLRVLRRAGRLRHARMPTGPRSWSHGRSTSRASPATRRSSRRSGRSTAATSSATSS